MNFAIPNQNLFSEVLDLVDIPSILGPHFNPGVADGTAVSMNTDKRGTVIEFSLTDTIKLTLRLITFRDRTKEGSDGVIEVEMAYNPSMNIGQPKSKAAQIYLFDNPIEAARKIRSRFLECFFDIHLVIPTLECFNFLGRYEFFEGLGNPLVFGEKEITFKKFNSLLTSIETLQTCFKNPNKRDLMFDYSNGEKSISYNVQYSMLGYTESEKPGIGNVQPKSFAVRLFNSRSRGLVRVEIISNPAAPGNYAGRNLEELVWESELDIKTEHSSLAAAVIINDKIEDIALMTQNLYPNGRLQEKAGYKPS